MPIELTVVVTIADNGGSTGKIREDYGIPAPGDLRRAVVALSSYQQLEKLMNYRFDEKLSGHTIGNLILTALVDINGSMQKAVEEYAKLLRVNQKIIPISNDSLQLQAIMEDENNIIGETNISSYPSLVKKMGYSSKGNINPEVITAVEECDAVILSSGSLYTSTIPNIIFPELQKVIKEKNKKIIYTANIMTQSGETDEYKLSDHINAINNHFGENKIDVVIANRNFVIPELIQKSYAEEAAELVRVDIENIDCKLILNDFLIISEDNHIRHNVSELARTIYKEVT